MSLKFFFDRRGKVMLSLFLLGWILNLINLYGLAGDWTKRGMTTRIVYVVFVFLALLLTLTRFKPWYSVDNRGFGLESHFEKTLVPLSYSLVITNLVFFVWENCWPFLLLTTCLLGLIQYVNCILIYFYLKDKDPTAPSFFSRSLYH